MAGKALAVAWVAGLDDILFAPELLLQSLQHPDDIRYLLVTDGPHGYLHRKDVLQQTVGLFALMEAQDAARATAIQGEPYQLPPLRDRLLMPPTLSAQRAERLRALADRVGQLHR